MGKLSMRVIKVYKPIILGNILVIFTFLGCSSYYNTGTRPYSNIYSLADNENLSTFIETQNRINRYTKYEHIPTEQKYKDMFLIMEEFNKEVLAELRELPDEMIQEMTEKIDDDITINEFIEIYLKLHFFYDISYNPLTRIWKIVLIGRSTTIILEYTSNQNVYYENDFGLANLIPPINDWMHLNNVPSADYSIRFNMNGKNNVQDFILEIDGKPYE